MMDDRTLLERAANAARIELRFLSTGTGPVPFSDGPRVGEWNPLTDDGDALRLAVKLNIDIQMTPGACVAAFANFDNGYGVDEREPLDADQDPYAATRRAIVRAAASMAGE